MAQDLVNHVGKLDFFYFMPEGGQLRTLMILHIFLLGMGSKNWQYRN